MKPVIGVMPLWDDGMESLWMLPAYLEGVREAGGIPMIFPFLSEREEIEQLADQCDGFLFTGGQDVTPALYHEDPLDQSVITSVQRDRLEYIVLHRAIADNKPILGICRGLQFINAALGGSLYQDIPTQHPSTLAHVQQKPYDVPSHDVIVRKESPLYALLEQSRLHVNSLHHQAVREVAPGLEIMAMATDGLVEALHMPAQKFLWAVQWHPEYAYKVDDSHRKIFEAFVDSMR